MRANYQYPILALVTTAASILLSACGTQANDTSTSSASPISTNIHKTPTTAPTIQVFTQQESPVQPTPDFLDTTVANGFLLSPSNDPDCQLPCWQGLRVGKSNRQDIQNMFDQVFNFDGALDIFDYPQGARNAALDMELDVPGTKIAGYAWIFQNRGYFVVYEMHTLVDEKTGILEGIRFLYDPGMIISEGNKIEYEGYYKLHTPQQIVQSLGAPDYVFTELSGGSYQIYLVYKHGIASFVMILVPWEHQSDGTLAGNICLNVQSGGMTDYIVAPFDQIDGINDLTPVQQKWIAGNVSQDPQLLPIDQILGLTISQFTEIAASKTNPCFRINEKGQRISAAP